MNTSRSFHPAGLTLALILAACSSGIPPGRDAEASTFPDRASTWVGLWAGNTRFLSSSSVYTTLQLEAPDGASGWLRYGGPANCRIELEAAGMSGDARRYDVTDSSGGSCDNALAGHLQLAANDGTAAITLFDASGKPLGNGTLQPAPVNR